MAYEFNGTDQYLSLASAVVTAVPLTMCALFRSTSDSVGQIIVGISNPTSGNDWFYLGALGASAGDPVAMQTRSVAAGAHRADTTTGYSANVWHSVVGASSAVNNRVAFIDGGSKGTNTISVTPLNLARTTIGALLLSTPSNYIVGRIAEAAIWNVALTDAEVASLGKGFRPHRIRPQSLVFYAPLIRNLQDTKGALAITNNNSATVAAHPRVY